MELATAKAEVESLKMRLTQESEISKSAGEQVRQSFSEIAMRDAMVKDLSTKLAESGRQVEERMTILRHLQEKAEVDREMLASLIDEVDKERAKAKQARTRILSEEEGEGAHSSFLSLLSLPCFRSPPHTMPLHPAPSSSSPLPSPLLFRPLSSSVPPPLPLLLLFLLPIVSQLVA
jgi:hypothetical protein